MELDRDGMVMNNNRTELPKDCAAISEELTFEVRAATIYAQAGFAYGFNQHEWRVPPCSKINVKFINEDQVRHQWMVHGLPKYLYPQGMFHLEASGGKSKQVTFIVPSDNQTYLVHCDLAQHMEKGLKGQLIVGSGNGNLPSIPGVTAHRYPDHY